MPLSCKNHYLGRSNFYFTENKNYYNQSKKKITISGTVYGTNNSAGGYVSATGYASFYLPSGTKVEFTTIRGSWSLEANGTSISNGYITSKDTTIEMTGTIPSGGSPRPQANYKFILNYSN